MIQPVGSKNRTMPRIRSAKSIQLQICDDCQRPHLVLYDDRGRPFAEAVIGEEIGPSLIALLQDLFDNHAKRLQ